jgi:hypothetical protein
MPESFWNFLYLQVRHLAFGGSPASTGLVKDVTHLSGSSVLNICSSYGTSFN